jgi:predicted RNA-binding protein with PUA-like domain
MRCGDRAFFYHSSCGKATGIYGVCEVVRTAFPDMGAVDPASDRFDAKAPPDGSKVSPGR